MNFQPLTVLVLALSISPLQVYAQIQERAERIPASEVVTDDGSLDAKGRRGSIDLSGWSAALDPEVGIRLSKANTPDGGWAPGFHAPGADRYVTDFAVSGENLYAIGLFSMIGDVQIGRTVAKWDGSTWSGLGSSIGSTVNALAASGDTVYVGGSFTQAGGVSANRIAMWNGASWSALGTGMDDAVDALAVKGDTLYAGGRFTVAGGQFASKIAMWDGAVWSGMGSGMTDDVKQLLIYEDTLYAGGSFTFADLLPAKYIAKWNGSSWSQVGNGLLQSVWSMTAHSDRIYAAVSDSVAVFDGSTWSELGTNSPGVVRSLQFFDGTLYAGQGGSATLWGWDGSSWSQVGEGVDDPMSTEGVNALTTHGGKLWVGGYFTVVGDSLAAHHIAKWDGSNWSSAVQGQGIGGDVNALTVSSAGIFAGGDFGTAGSVKAIRAAKWDGSEWSPLGEGLTGLYTHQGNVYALAAKGDSVYVGGSFTKAGGAPASRIAMWNGTAWSTLGDGVNGSVYSLLLDDDTLYVGGDFSVAGGSGGVAAPNVARWDGSSWSGLGAGTNGAVRAIAIYRDTLYVGGSFAFAGGVPAENIARWDGSSWSPLGFGVDNTVHALVPWNDGLYVGGEFTLANGSPANRLARWDGSAWSALSSGLNQTVKALQVKNDSVFAGGTFSTAGGNSASGIAVWDGSTWSALGSGMSSQRSVNALAVGSLYAGGGFTLAGGGVSSHFAANHTVAADLHEGFALDAFLEGAYVAAGDSMTTEMHSEIPLLQPYSSAPFLGTSLEYHGSESMTTVPEAAVDWVLVKVMKGDPTSPPMDNIATHAGILLSDGSIVEPDGSLPLVFDNLAEGDYYITVCHRNHLCAMSNAVYFVGGSPKYDFTTTSGFTTGPSPQKVLESSPSTRYGLFAGNAAVNTSIGTPDYDAFVSAANAGAFGYVQEDFNMNRMVEATDFNLYIANAAAGASSQVP